MNLFCHPQAGSLDIIQQAHVCLQRVNPLIEGFQRPTLGPVRNFDIMSGEFFQILHTGSQHWVCISTIQSVPSAVKLYDGLCNDIILDEVKDQAKSLLADSFLGIENVPVQQQIGLIVVFLPLLLKLVLFMV